MKAVVWHGKRDVRVETVPDPQVRESTDAVIRVTSTGLCGSDLHLYEVLGPYLEPGDVLGHEPMGVVEEVGAEVEHIRPGDRVVVPFTIACGRCFMCERGLYAQCETTQVRSYGKGAALFGYTKLYGQVPGGQAEYVRVPQAHFGPIKVPDDRPDDRYVYLSDVLPTAWQAVQDAHVPQGGSLAVLGLGPIGQMCCRIALHLGAERVFGVDLVPERLELARRFGVVPVDLSRHRDVPGVLADRTEGRGPDSVIDAVGMEAHGSPAGKVAHSLLGVLPDRLAQPAIGKAGVDRLSALHTAIAAVRRGGTVSITGVYGGMVDPMPMMELFDKQVTLTMGQANVRRWVDDLMPLLQQDADPLDVDNFATHHLPLDEAPDAYAMFQQKRDGVVKVILTP